MQEVRILLAKDSWGYDQYVLGYFTDGVERHNHIDIICCFLRFYTAFLYYPWGFLSRR